METKDLINELEEVLVIGQSKLNKAEALLNELKISLNTVKEDKLMTAVETAEMLRTSVPSIRNMTCRKMIPFRKLGSKVLYSRNEIETYLLKEKYNAVGI